MVLPTRRAAGRLLPADGHSVLAFLDELKLRYVASASAHEDLRRSMEASPSTTTVATVWPRTSSVWNRTRVLHHPCPSRLAQSQIDRDVVRAALNNISPFILDKLHADAQHPHWTWPPGPTCSPHPGDRRTAASPARPRRFPHRQGTPPVAPRTPQPHRVRSLGANTDRRRRHGRRSGRRRRRPCAEDHDSDDFHFLPGRPRRRRLPPAAYQLQRVSRLQSTSTAGATAL